MWQGGIGLDQHLRVLYLFQQRCSGTGAKTVHINIHDSQRWCDQRCIRVIVEGDNRNVLRNAQAELTDCLDDADGDKTVKAQNAVGEVPVVLRGRPAKISAGRGVPVYLSRNSLRILWG